jgi:hypothetical protein
MKRGSMIMSECHLTNRHPATLGLIRSVLVAFHDECAANPVATISEGHLKVVAMRALLAAGATLIEGSGNATINKKLSLRDGRLHIEAIARRTTEENLVRMVADLHRKAADRPRMKQTSSDLRVFEPCRLVFELQARSIYGSQDTLFWANLVDDYERLTSGRADVFIIACDAPIYDLLRGNRRDRRGRKAGFAADEARELLPSIEMLPVGVVSDTHELRSSRFGRLRALGCRTAVSVAVERVVLATWAVSPSIETDPELERIRSILQQHMGQKEPRS